jgi:PhnB protein
MTDNIRSEQQAIFAPQLFIRVLAPAIAFYQAAFGSIELRRFANPDGSVHVSELSIGGAMFHLHEEVARVSTLSPERTGITTVLLGLFVDDPGAMAAMAVAAGAREISPVKDYEYGYRQATVADPFGHQWLLQKKI